jgi:hypothetical protein
MSPEIVALSKALSEQRFEAGKQVRGSALLELL